MPRDSRNVNFISEKSSYSSSKNSSYENTSELNYMHRKIIDLKDLSQEIEKDDIYGLID